MFHTCILQLCGLGIALGTVATALGQSYLPPSQTYNPFSALQGYAGQALRDQYRQNTGAPSLNQQALRNAQQAMQQSYSPAGGMPSAGRIGLGLDTSYSGQKVEQAAAGPDKAVEPLDLPGQFIAVGWLLCRDDSASASAAVPRGI